MYLTPFVSLFREQGQAETRTFTPVGDPQLPADQYALVESYCPDPKCDCRRVMLNVASRRSGRRFLASISFGFDRKDEMAGPFLDPLNPQSQYANALLEMVKRILEDRAYVRRLESHYRQVKQAAADPSSPAYATIQRLLAEERAELEQPVPARPAARSTVRKERKRKRRK